MEGSTTVACVATCIQKLKQVAEELQAQQSMFQTGLKSQALTVETEVEAKQQSVLSDDSESDEDSGSGLTDSKCDSDTDSPLESLFSECSHDLNEQRLQVSSQVSNGEIFQYGRNELQKLQECDPTLGNIRQHVREEAELDICDGFFYRRATEPGFAGDISVIEID